MASRSRKGRSATGCLALLVRGLLNVRPGQRGAWDWLAANLVYPEGHELAGECEKNPAGDDRCRMYMPHDSKLTNTPGAYAVADTLNKGG